MELSKKDRLILANQYRILELLDTTEAKSHQQTREVLEQGYAIHYREFCQHLSDEFTDQQSREVMEILEMYTALKRSYEGLQDKDGVDSARIEFRGFDGNEETEYMSYVKFLINEMGRWRDLKTNDLNTHFPVLDQYRKMLARWNKSADKNQLTSEDILRILTV